jgi:hypothetical protein
MMGELIIFAACMIGSNVMAYNIGIRTGAEGMIDSLMDGGDKDQKTGITTIIIEPENDNG